MKNAKKGLQKFTETKTKIGKLLQKETFEESDIAGFTEGEMRELHEQVRDTLDLLKGDGKKALAYLEKVEPIVEQDIKNQIWENNHTSITVAISEFMYEFGRMPNKNDISTKTGLSRTTVHKHLKGYNTSPVYKEQLETFRFMHSKVMAKVFKFAVNGDMKAAKLYLEFTGNPHGQTPNSTSIQNQTNNIQINGMVLSQETVRQLTPEQLTQIEAVLKSAANVLP